MTALSADDVTLFLRHAREVARRAEGRVQVEELQRACALLERERAKYVDLFESAQDAYVVTTERGVVIDANLTASQLFGVEARQLQGKPLIGFVARQDTRDFRAYVRELQNGGSAGSARDLSIRMRPRGQAVFVASVRVATVQGLQGSPMALRWTICKIDEALVRRASR